jgi:hypothetical protein
LGNVRRRVGHSPNLRSMKAKNPLSTAMRRYPRLDFQSTSSAPRDNYNQCWGSGSGTESACFWASPIRILTFSHKGVERTK